MTPARQNSEFRMSATATATEQAPNRLAGFVPIHVGTLRATKSHAVDLFVHYESHSEPMLYCRAGIHPEDQQFAELAEVGVENFYVRSDDFAELSNDVMTSLDSLIKRDDLRRTEKFAALQIAVAVTVDQLLRLVDCSKFQALAAKIGDDLVRLFGDGDVLPCEMFRLARHDFNTFTHVTNVASYCVMLAKELGINGDNELRKIATAAILHDLGKRFIPSRILSKTTKLTPEEREIIESHPTRGYVELCEKSEFDFGQLMMVYQHHEHMDGTGYPVRVLKDEIHPWARMLAVVDVFDTMTAQRPDNRTATAGEVLDYQRQRAGTQFDREAVECWISAMTKT
jgi:HD-GYP domain-containing protein (c-di-GMP phosphodiesterase class II)